MTSVYCCAILSGKSEHKDKGCPLKESCAFLCHEMARIVWRVKHRVFKHFAFAVLAPLVSIPLCSQQSINTQPTGNSDQGIQLPQAAIWSPRVDGGAIIEITAYRSAIGLTAWEDMMGTGELNSTGSGLTGSNGSEQATLWIRNNDECRLDLQKQKGTTSMRIDGLYGAIQHEDGHRKAMDARDAVGELLAFPALMQATFPPAYIMLIDQGMVTVDGATLHRITMERLWPSGAVDAKGALRTRVTDLYFNPQTHQLMKSSLSIYGTRPEPNQMLQVISYGNYSSVNGMLIPHSFRETLNGQVLWTLQLNEVRVNQGLQASDFHF